MRVFRVHRYHRYLLVAGATLAVGCSRYSGGTGSPRSVPPPTADAKTLRTYAESLPYWDRLGAADRQPVGEQGVLTTIEPEMNAYQLSKDELFSGRIVSRIVKNSAGELRQYGLGEKDTVAYWLVYQKDGVVMGRFFSQTVDTTYRIDIDWHDGSMQGKEPQETMAAKIPWGQSIAQWRYQPDGGPGSPELFYSAVARKSTAWVTCTQYGCCKTR